MSDALILVAPVALPMVAIAIALMLRNRPRASEGFSLAVLIGTLIAALLLLVRATDGGTLAITVFGGWPSGFGVSFAARLPGVALVVVTMLIAVAVAIYGDASVGARRRRNGHDALTLAMVAAVNGAFLTNDLFNLYVWFELALLAALGSITLDRREQQVGAAVRYATLGIVGATAMLAGVGLIYGSTGTLDLGALAARLSGTPPTVATATAAALLMGGFALKSGVVPLHVWLPAAYAPAPISVAAAFAGLLTKMGFYALLLIAGGVFAIGSGGVGAAHITPILALIAAATMLLCSLGALAQNDIRRLLGYHVVAQVGYMLAALALGTRSGVEAAVFYMVHSMIVQTNLFLGAGVIHRATGSWDLRTMGGMLKRNPVFCALFAVPMLSLAGIPPFSGFWGKVLVFRAAIDAGNLWLLSAGVIAALLTIFSVAILWSASCWKDLKGRSARAVPVPMLAGMALLSAVTVAIGLMPGPVHSIAQLSAAALGRMGMFG